MTHNTGDPLRDLAHSTQDFFARFDVTPTPEATIKVFREEAEELIEAARNGVNKDHIAEEAADVFVTAIGICYASGIDPEQLVRQVYAVVAKNDAKTRQTHVHLDGKIRRRPPP